jgi:alpha-glucosidase
MKSFSLFLLLNLIWAVKVSAQTSKKIDLQSPDGSSRVEINLGPQIQFSVFKENIQVLGESSISMTLASGQILGKNVQIKSIRRSSLDQELNTPIYKKAKIRDHYNQVILSFKNDFGLIFRAYDEGIAYRFFTQKKDSLTILDEEALYGFIKDSQVWAPFINDYRNHDKFNTSFEAHYSRQSLSKLVKDSLAFLPILIESDENKKLVILESDLQDYPGMYLTSASKNQLKGVFAKFPNKEHTRGNAKINYVVDSRENYIAKTAGTRFFPWRVFVLSTEDKELANNDLMQKLSAPSQVKDLSWIKPGKVAWDWWNDWNITGVDFEAGINVETYKNYIDFAASNHLEYIIIDEGWSDDWDLNQYKINLDPILAYAREKNIGVILWATWYSVHEQPEAIFSKFSKLGVKGFKVDFIDRDDQKMVSSLYDLAKIASENHLLLDFHGMYKPSGFQRTYPNVINFEGVKGLENMKWGTDNQPEYDVTIPFIRMISGPMDYTPGGMRNATKSSFRPVNSNPMTQGTRSHQLAMYTIFEAPLQMLADNPTIYKREQESTDYIASVPTTFDETIALDGKVGEFISLARRKGTTWFVGAMTNWDRREINLDLNFLGDGNYTATIFEDGVNASKDATDYKKLTLRVSSRDKIKIKMASGGGWAARFEKINEGQ